MSLYIRARDKACVCCGSTENLQNGHYFSRVYVNIRFSFTNCNTQCASCNVLHELDPEPYREFMVQKYGESEIFRLRTLAHAYKKLTRADYQQIEQEIDYRMKGIS